MTVPQLPTTGLEDPNRRKRLVEVVNQITRAPTWIEPTLLNSWVNFGSGFSPAGYYKDALGRVHLRGLVHDGTSATALFTLPAGFRPAFEMLFPARATDATETTEQYGLISITAAGDVVAGSIVATGAQLSIEGISFLAEQ